MTKNFCQKLTFVFYKFLLSTVEQCTVSSSYRVNRQQHFLSQEHLDHYIDANIDANLISESIECHLLSYLLRNILVCCRLTRVLLHCELLQSRYKYKTGSIVFSVNFSRDPGRIDGFNLSSHFRNIWLVSIYLQ